MIGLVSFLGISLVSTSSGKSHFISATQLLRTVEDKSVPVKSKYKKKAKQGKKKKEGRPKGSKNKDKKSVESLCYKTLKRALSEVLEALSRSYPTIKVPYLVGDGAYGNQSYFELAQNMGFKLISKLRSDSALTYPYCGKQKAKGRHRIYGKKVNYKALKSTHKVVLPEKHPLHKKNIKIFQF